MRGALIFIKITLNHCSQQVSTSLQFSRKTEIVSYYAVVNQICHV